MKKTYINPTTDVVKVQTQQMIAVSLYGENATDDAMGRSLDEDGEDFFFDTEELYKFSY